MSNTSTDNTLRWSVAFIIVVTFHTIAAIGLIVGWNPLPPKVPNPPAAVMIELAALPEAPNNSPQPEPAPKEQIASDPTPVPHEPIKEPDPLPDPKPIEAPKPKVVIAKQQKPKPIKKPIKEPVEKPLDKPKQLTEDTKPKAEVTTNASMASNNISDKTAAPATTSSASPSKAQITWTAQLYSQIARYKRYPSEARYKHQEGIVTVNFTITSDGRVLDKRIVKSSNFPLLDQEVLDLLSRAEPLPKPPADILKGGNSRAITIPINFNLKKDR